MTRARPSRLASAKQAIAAGVVVLLACAASADAQLRGRLTSRPPVPTAGPRVRGAPALPRIPVWWPWGVVLLPDTTTLVPVRLADGAPTGGVQLDVLPWSAQVYVDGSPVGRVEEFRGYYHHLELPAGPHVIDIVAAGHPPLRVEIVVIPGRTITYRGTVR
jgi:hypothetical protein